MYRTQELFDVDGQPKVHARGWMLAKGQCRTGRLWAHVRDDRPFGGTAAPAAVFYYSATREGEHAERQLARYTGIVQADAYSGFNGLFVEGRQPGPIIEAACWAHNLSAPIHNGKDFPTPSRMNTLLMAALGRERTNLRILMDAQEVDKEDASTFTPNHDLRLPRKSLPMRIRRSSSASVISSPSRTSSPSSRPRFDGVLRWPEMRRGGAYGLF